MASPLCSLRIARTRDRGFTLIELLVVISIIVILMGLLLVSITGVRTHARKAMAKTEVEQLAAAWKHYYSEYNRWPSFAPVPESWVRIAPAAPPVPGGDALMIMTGELCPNNPRRIPFAQFNRLNLDGTPVSPWGRDDVGDADTDDDVFYYVMFDTDYNNTLEATAASLGDRTWDSPLATNVNESVIVWAVNQDLVPADREYIIGSWTD